MKKYLKIVLPVLIVILLVIGFNLHSNKSEAIVIGVPLPLTGNSASLAERVKAAMELGLKDASVGVKHTYRLQFEDDKADPQTEISVVQKLISVDGAKVMLGFIKSDPLLAVAPVTEKNKIVLISATAGADKISDAGDYIFRLIEKANVHGETMTNFLNKNGVKSVALFTADASNAKSYSNAFKTAFLNASGTIPLETSYKPDATDFRTDIAKAKSAKVQAVYLAVATAKDAGLITKQLREQGFTGIIAASVATDAKEFFDTAGNFANGVYITASYFDPIAAQNKAVDGFSANGYDSVRLIIDASESCNGVANTDCIRDYLYGVKNYQGLGGTLSFDAKGDVIKPVLIKVAKDGAFSSI